MIAFYLKSGSFDNLQFELSYSKLHAFYCVYISYNSDDKN